MPPAQLQGNLIWRALVMIANVVKKGAPLKKWGDKKNRSEIVKEIDMDEMKRKMWWQRNAHSLDGGDKF